MKTTFTLLFTFIGFFCTAQLHHEIDDSGKPYFAEVVENITGNKTEIASKVKLWFADYFKNANAVLQIEDIEKGIFVGKGSTIIWNNITMRFTCRVDIKEGRARISTYDMRYEVPAGSGAPAMTYTANDVYVKWQRKDGSYKPISTRYQKNTTPVMEETFKSFKAAMLNESSAPGGSDW